MIPTFPRNSLTPVRLALSAAFVSLALAAGCGSSDESPSNTAPGANTCSSNGDCPGSRPYCNDQSRCVECVGDGNCQGGQVCDSISGQCKHSCTTDADCTNGGENLCDPRGVCVRCIDDGDCGGGDPFCSQSLDRCVECITHADCGAGQPVCLSTGNCVQCASSADCGSNQYCNNDHECRDKCLSNTDCGGDRPVCNTGTGDCVECGADSDCGAGQPYCDLTRYRCVECLENGNCPQGQVCRPNSECGNP